MRVFVKLGGSLITDKTQEATFLPERMARLAAEIAAARAARPEMQLLIGHGSGSFGHFVARRHDTMSGVQTAEQWRGFAAVSRTVRQLNQLVIDTLAAAGLPVWALQPSASARCRDGLLETYAAQPVKEALAHGLVPLVYGDVALDAARGGTIISTETLFDYLAPRLRPAHILLVGEVPGVLDAAGEVVPRITPGMLAEVEAALGGSHGVDVTGGMASKVRGMVQLVERVPGLTIHILSGVEPGLVEAALRDPVHASGTRIAAVAGA